MAKSIGMGGDLTFNSVAVHVTEWSIAVNNEVQDVTDTGSAGWQEMIAGINKATINATCFWNLTGTELSTTFAIGTIHAATAQVGPTPGGGGTAQTFTGNFIVSDFNVKNNAKTPIEFTVTLQSTGEVTMP